MVRAHKPQIGLEKYFGSILGLGSGSLQPTMNPYGLLVMKQRSQCGQSSSPRDLGECLWSRFLKLMGGFYRVKGGKKMKVEVGGARFLI